VNQQRSTRLGELIKEEVSDILLRSLKDPRIGFVSVTDVEVTSDLRQVKIFVSVLGDESAKKDTMKALDSATGFVRSEIGKRIRLRYTPEVMFKFDNSIERGSRISKILNDIKSEEAAKSSSE
jgi:ribosome-binding factor A